MGKTSGRGINCIFWRGGHRHEAVAFNNRLACFVIVLFISQRMQPSAFSIKLYSTCFRMAIVVKGKPITMTLLHKNKDFAIHICKPFVQTPKKQTRKVKQNIPALRWSKTKKQGTAELLHSVISQGLCFEGAKAERTSGYPLMPTHTHSSRSSSTDLRGKMFWKWQPLPNFSEETPNPIKTPAVRIHVSINQADGVCNSDIM